jgi:hypothetical protein
LRVFVGVLHMIEGAATQGWREALAAFDKRWPGRIPAWPCNTRHGAARGVYEFEYSLNSPLSASYIAPGCSNGQTVAAALASNPGGTATGTSCSTPFGGSCATGCLWYYPGQSTSGGAQPISSTRVFVGVLHTPASQLS